MNANGIDYDIQIKSGQKNKDYLTISGHRLGRFKENFEEITKYLNNKTANIISVSYNKIDDESGRCHAYHVCYIDVEHLTKIAPNGWCKSGKTYEQIVSNGVVFSLRPSMSWQIWWKIPHELVEEAKKFEIT